MITKRSELKVGELYLDASRASYFWSPDGFGVFWLTPEEADEQFGEETPANCIEELED